ncbi:hypothetical protein HDK64DRAFT_134742 [Phyllosticta capitalensis]
MLIVITVKPSLATDDLVPCLLLTSYTYPSLPVQLDVGHSHTYRAALCARHAIDLLVSPRPLSQSSSATHPFIHRSTIHMLIAPARAHPQPPCPTFGLVGGPSDTYLQITVCVSVLALCSYVGRVRCSVQLHDRCAPAPAKSGSEDPPAPLTLVANTPWLQTTRRPESVDSAAPRHAVRRPWVGMYGDGFGGKTGGDGGAEARKWVATWRRT